MKKSAQFCQGFLRFLIINFIFAGFFSGHLSNAYAEADFLPPEQAFQFEAKQISPDKVEVTFSIADGYYMYVDRYEFKADGATLGTPDLPKGKIKFDENFQKEVETYRHVIHMQIPVISVDKLKSTFTFITISQGCSDQGLCYIPMESKISFDSALFLPEGHGASGSILKDSNKLSNMSSSLNSGNYLIIIPLFILLGLGLAFTPCVLPMVPILSSIIVGEGAHANKRRGLILSLSYSFGMALVYTGLGVAAGLLGEGLAAALQNPLVLSLFALLLVGLSLSMFNVYHLQVPGFILRRLAHFSGQQKAGKLIGVFIMGAVSGLIVGPCVAAPLASALLYIGQTHNVIVGGVALFSLAMGMSIPLILVGLSAGSLLPRAGRWMESIKQLFGVLILAMALWLVSPVLPVWLQMTGWAILLIGYGGFLFRYRAALPKMAALILCAIGFIELAGVATGGRDVLSPLAHLSGNSEQGRIQFVRIKSLNELDKSLAQAQLQGKPVMLDFYADWCVSCKEMEKFTFTDKRVKDRFSQMVLLQVDVTENTPEDRAFLKKFNLFGPPATIFFSRDAKESGRVIGFENADKFLNSLAMFVK